MAALKQLEQLLDNPTPKTDGAGKVDEGVAFRARMTALIPKIKDAQTTGHPGALDAKLKASEAGLLAGKGNFQGAHQLLDQAEEWLLATDAPKTKERNAPGGPEGGAPIGRVGLEVLRNELRTLRAQAVGGLTELVTRLQSDPHPQAAAIAQIVTQLSRQMPSEMQEVLTQMDEAISRNDTAAMATHRASVRKGATDWLAFLQANQEPIQGCESNPWGIPIQIDKPFRASLSAILKTAQ